MIDEMRLQPLLHVAPDVCKLRVSRHLKRVRQLERDDRDAFLEAAEITERSGIYAQRPEIQRAEALGRFDAGRTVEVENVVRRVHILDVTLERLCAWGAKLVGSVETYGTSYTLCYVRGPNGIIIEVAEKLS